MITRTPVGVGEPTVSAGLSSPLVEYAPGRALPSGFDGVTPERFTVSIELVGADVETFSMRLPNGVRFTVDIPTGGSVRLVDLAAGGPIHLGPMLTSIVARLDSAITVRPARRGG